jgi:hypothetical protein
MAGASFVDSSGAPKLPRLTPAGAVPVAVADDVPAPEWAAQLLLEMRGLRIGLELLNDLEPGDLLMLARNEE